MRNKSWVSFNISLLYNKISVNKYIIRLEIHHEKTYYITFTSSQNNWNLHIMRETVFFSFFFFFFLSYNDIFL